MSNCVDEVRATPLSRRTTKCWSTQQGLACRQACEPWEKIGCLLPFNILPVIDWYSYCDWFISRRGGMITSLSPLLFHKLVVASSLV
jgi:hypothetical protein